ncbi:hypothetical protein DPMN_082681 [Dreissena polymorpha]|uniref:Uncharacterized protein n=1 Tax=Dreissena polymorpha TaxID=45954 RepID=A0A9D3YBE3_DREPO|nr:hypothetical protein DPMN_082681 [Dreissena polymorpha]
MPPELTDNGSLNSGIGGSENLSRRKTATVTQTALLLRVCNVLMSWFVRNVASGNTGNYAARRTDRYLRRQIRVRGALKARSLRADSEKKKQIKRVVIRKYCHAESVEVRQSEESAIKT